MRVTRRVIATLAAAGLAALAGPGAIAAAPAGAAAVPAKRVAAFPSPGDRFASPQTTISFRGATPAALGAVRVTGSRSGVHAGRLVADPDGSTIWQPRAAFVPGERVTVRTATPIAGAGGNSFGFTVARIAPRAPEVLPPESGTGPSATVSTSAGTSYVVQEIDIATGNVLFTWKSLDHVPVTDSDYPVPSNGAAFDYFHGNSIALTSDGNLLISGRNVSAVYSVNRSTGAIMWELGGKHSSFTLQPSGQQWFCYQHHVRQPQAGVITIFDDGGSGPATCPNHASRALTLSLDTTSHTAAITRDLQHNPALHAGYLGSNQTLSNGDALVSWGNLSEITEFSAAGQSNFDMSLSGSTYRAFRTAWTGTPYYPPAVAARKGSGNAVTVDMSWNGDTQVASWQVLAGSSPSSLRPVGRPVPKTTFQSEATVDTSAPLVAAQARDASGNVLATSPAVPDTYTPPGRGYYVGTQAGNVYNYDAPFDGSPAASGKKPAAPLVGTAVPATRSGYYLPSSAGNVYNYGAPFYGSLAASGRKAPSPVVGLGPYRGTGYYLATSGGNVYNYGKAPFDGSPHSSGSALSAPVSGVAVDRGGGYWLVKRDGGVLNYGSPWYGSERGTALPAPVVGIAAEPDGHGYLLVTAKGNVYNFGQAPWYGSPAASVVNLSSPVVGIGMRQATAARQQRAGYYVVCANGDVYNYGIFLPGSPNGLPLPAAIDGVGAR